MVFKKIVLLFVVIVALNSCYVFALSPQAPRGWLKYEGFNRASLSAASYLNITIALNQRNMDVLEARLKETSNPSHPNYGNHMSFDEVVDLVAPHQANIDTVINWLRTENNVKTENIYLYDSKDFIRVVMSVEESEAAFQTSFLSYFHEKTGMIGLLADKDFVLPKEISEHVSFISRFNAIRNVAPLNSFEIARLLSPSPAELSSAGVAVANSNSPIFFGGVGAFNKSLSLQFFVFCKDGTNPTVETYDLKCGGTGGYTISLEIDAVDPVSQKILSTTTKTLSYSNCRVCSSIQNCYAVSNLGHSSVDSRWVWCVGTVDTVIQNYTPLYPQITAVYSDQTYSNSTLYKYIIETSDGVTPDTIFRTHSIPADTKVSHKKNKQSVGALLGESMSKVDLQLYFERNGIKDYSSLVTIQNSEYNYDTPTAEASLDVQAIMGVAQNCPTVFWAMDPYSSILDWITDVVNNKNAAWVNSLSYGESESYIYNTRDRLNNEFIKAGSRGITIVVSSGDSGVYSSTTSLYYTGRSPDFPASSPYVTSVGATLLSTQYSPSCSENLGKVCNDTKEIVASIATGAIITSGGGFSAFFERPDYQAKVVPPYLNTLPTFTYSNNRAYPDVSALGHNVPVVVNAKSEVLDGTSASAPFFAGIVSLLNDIRLKKGDSTLGFINPFLYSLDKSAFNDIVVGDNDCSNLLCGAGNGFPASEGFDAVTGLGSVNFVEVSKAVKNLPGKSWIHKYWWTIAAGVGGLVVILVVGIVIYKRKQKRTQYTQIN